MLWDYEDVIRETNKGSIVYMQVHRPLPSSAPVFERYYICFQTLKKGLDTECRPFSWVRWVLAKVFNKR
ncbi:hypothetical protein REPUB_Repub19eG0074100 [Reevesia pubescens]